MNFLAVKSAKNLYSLHSDGILGLSPKKPSETDNIDLFITQMKNYGIIKK